MTSSICVMSNDDFSQFDKSEETSGKSIFQGKHGKEFFDFEIVTDFSESGIIEKKGIWGQLKEKISNMKNILAFNVIQGENKFDKESNYLIQIFDKKYKLNDGKEEEDFTKKLQNLIYFSYRSNFEEIIYKNNRFTSDAGWGCTIRVGQMMIAQGIFQLNEYQEFSEFAKEKLFLFLEDSIPRKELKIKEKKSNQIDNPKHHTYFKCFEKTIQVDYTTQKTKDKIIPPFSLRNILRTDKSSSKGAGDWFSNTDIIRIISQINEKYSPLKCDDNSDCEIFHFNDGTLDLKAIFKKCLVEPECSCGAKGYGNIEQNKSTYQSYFGFELLNHPGDSLIEKPCDCITKNSVQIKNKYLTMAKKCLIFISVRHGLYSLDENVEKDILDFFDTPNNIGIIGGKKTRSLYFIGRSGRNLIFMDPHFVQKCCTSEEITFTRGKNTYKPKDIYYIDISEMSPTFTLGFYCRKNEDFLNLIDKFKKGKSKENLFSIKSDFL